MDAIILYPTMDAEVREARIAINDPMYGTSRAHVVLRPVNLLQLDQLIIEERNVRAGLAPALVAGLAAAGSFAQWLAFGE